MRQRDLIPFFVMSFLIAWGILGLYIFTPDTMNRLFGNLTGEHPLFYLAVYAPAIAALALILYRHGLSGTRNFLSRLLMLRTSAYWYMILFAVVPSVFYGAYFLKEGRLIAPFPFDSLKAYLFALFFMAIKGPVEEIGWRGLALPMLQRSMAPIWAGLILGIVWGIWHLPAFFLSGIPHGGWSFVPFFLGTIALSIIVTPLFNDSRGSILLPAFFHLQLINPLWPDAQPYDTWIFTAIAVMVVWLRRDAMFSRDAGVTELVPE